MLTSSFIGDRRQKEINLEVHVPGKDTTGFLPLDYNAFKIAQ